MNIRIIYSFVLSAAFYAGSALAMLTQPSQQLGRTATRSGTALGAAAARYGRLSQRAYPGTAARSYMTQQPAEQHYGIPHSTGYTGLSGAQRSQLFGVRALSTTSGVPARTKQDAAQALGIAINASFQQITDAYYKKLNQMLEGYTTTLSSGNLPEDLGRVAHDAQLLHEDLTKFTRGQPEAKFSPMTREKAAEYFKIPVNASPQAIQDAYLKDLTAIYRFSSADYKTSPTHRSTIFDNFIQFTNLLNEALAGMLHNSEPLATTLPSQATEILSTDNQQQRYEYQEKNKKYHTGKIIAGISLAALIVSSIDDLLQSKALSNHNKQLLKEKEKQLETIVSDLYTLMKELTELEVPSFAIIIFREDREDSLKSISNKIHTINTKIQQNSADKDIEENIKQLLDPLVAIFNNIQDFLTKYKATTDKEAINNKITQMDKLFLYKHPHKEKSDYFWQAMHQYWQQLDYQPSNKISARLTESMSPEKPLQSYTDRAKEILYYYWDAFKNRARDAQVEPFI